MNNTFQLNRFFPLKLLFFIFCGLLFSCAGNQNTEVEKPNVVFVMLDDFGYAQVAFNSLDINEKDFDSLFVAYALENGDYSPAQALAFSQRATPTLTRMAQEGMIFTQAFTSSNLCAPSRIGIATGMLQNRRGIYRNLDCEALGPAPGSLLVEKLHQAGYATAHIGKWHIGSKDESMVPKFMKKHGISDSAGIYPPLAHFPEVRKDLVENGYMGSCTPGHHPLNNGFDYYYGYNTWESPFYMATNVWNGFEHVSANDQYNTDLFTQKAIGFISESIDRDQPFYVQIHYHAVHSPLEPKAPDPYFNVFDSESFFLNNFYAHVFAVDENIRMLRDFLTEKGVAENTIFVFTSDNGGSVGDRSTLPGNAPYRGHKGMYLLGGIRVPLFFHWPSGISNPGSNQNLVSALDILPTILDAAGINPPDSLDGKSLLPYLIHTSNKPVHDYLIWSGIHATTWGFMRQHDVFPEVPSRDRAPFAWAVVKDGYILRHVGPTIPGLYKDRMEGQSAYTELFHFQSDPGEKINLADQKPELVQSLKSLWEKEAVNFPPPVKIGWEKWQEIIPERNIYFKDQKP